MLFFWPQKSPGLAGRGAGVWSVVAVRVYLPSQVGRWMRAGRARTHLAANNRRMGQRRLPVIRTTTLHLLDKINRVRRRSSTSVSKALILVEPSSRRCLIASTWSWVRVWAWLISWMVSYIQRPRSSRPWRNSGGRLVEVWRRSAGMGRRLVIG